MNTCVNIEASEFRALKERSGLSDFLLEVLVGEYQDQHNGAWPHLDELPIDWVDSKKALDQFLELDKRSMTTQEKLLEKTGTQSLEEARVYLNDVYRNLSIDYYTINDKVKITIDKMPNPFQAVREEQVDLSELSSTVYINQALQELENKMGIVTHATTTKELGKSGILNAIPEASTAAAFVYQGEIYVNQDNADVDAKTHELMHVMLGGLKFKNPELYMQLTGTVENLENYGDLTLRFPNRARQDVNEELFVSEYAKMLKGLPSLLTNLDPNIIYDVNYEMSRALDRMLMGDDSVRVIPANERFDMTFRELGAVVNAHNMENTIQSYVDGAVMHRILANKKSDLMKSGNLIEECD